MANVCVPTILILNFLYSKNKFCILLTRSSMSAMLAASKVFRFDFLFNLYNYKWVGDIENWMDEDYLINMFANTGTQVTQAKIIRDHNTGIPLGYDFVEFGSNEMANKVLQLLNTSINPATNKPFKLNWGQDRGSNQMMGYKGGMMRGGMGFNKRWNNQGGRGQNYNQNYIITLI